MRQVQLALHRIVQAFALAHQFRYAENRRQGVVQFVRDAGKHLANRGKFFGLDKLFAQPLQFGDVAPGKNHAFDLSAFIEQRAEVEEDAAPFAELVPHANFQGAEILFALQDVRIQREQRRKIVGMRAAAKLHLVRIVQFVSENFTAARAHERIIALCVDHQN